MLQFLLAAGVVLLGQPTPVTGSIAGVVVNASRDGAPVGGAEVVLRVKLEGQFVTAAEVRADAQGRFEFSGIPATDEYVYLPGANLAGIHYPGPRVRLSARQPRARVSLPVHEAVADPNPLVLRRHEITLQPQTDSLKVRETLLIDNPSLRTYVGRPAREGGRAATLRLSIAPDFRRTTFDQEFFGRQFTLIDDRLVTDVPWTPGQRELSFTYVVPNDDRHRVWQRPLDLPCDQLRITVHTETPDEVQGNLPRAASAGSGTVVFESSGQRLPAGHLVSLQLERLPLSLATYGRWIALGLLLALVAAASLIGARRRGGKAARPADRPPVRAPRKAA